MKKHRESKKAYPKAQRIRTCYYYDTLLPCKVYYMCTPTT